MKFFRIFFNFLILLFVVENSFAQVCTGLGQTPSTAFPVCGTTTFVKDSVPICSSNNLFVPGCTGGSNSSNYENKNPFWYKFTCYTTGTLSFTITPANNEDDYDWQLYDITGLPPDEVFTNRNIIVSGNWSGSPGPTGASSSGVNFIQCSSVPSSNAPRFALSPTLIQGHDYILLVSHYDGALQSGYSLSFSGGTANITDPLDPHLLRASAPCDGTEIRIKLNKKMKCTSLAANGSDFEIVTPTNTILVPSSAVSFQCASGFDLDSAAIFLTTTLPAGIYKLRAKNGSDGNTLKDNCDRTIPVGEEISFTVFPLFPTPMDSIEKPACAPQKLVLKFRKKIKCSSIAADGSDFFITGTYPVTIASAAGNCAAGDDNTITLQLSAPLQVAGNFFVNLKVGTDGNTILDECNVQTPIPDDVAFVIKDTVNADFTFTINYACAKNTVNYFHNGANTVNGWQWQILNQPVNTTQNPSIIYANTVANTMTTLTVNNGVCYDTSKQTIVFDNYMNAQFETPPYVCPNKPVNFKNTTIGNITNWHWTFGNGNTSGIKNPTGEYYVNQPTTDYNVFPQLITTNNYGCNDTATNKVQVLYSCFISVPTAFTPNGDGLNDYLSPVRKFNGSDLNFSVYNRFGQRVFYTNSWDQRWDGKYKGEPQMPGTYVWTLDYVNLETGLRLLEKGSTVLIR